MTKVEWLCSRCSEKTGKKTEPDPVILRLCTECKVENWVRPFGHSGEAVVASEEEKKEAFDKQVAESELSNKVIKAFEEQRKAKTRAEFDEVKAKLQEEPPDETVVEEAEEPTEAEADAPKPDPKEEEIAKLKAKLAELEK